MKPRGYGPTGETRGRPAADQAKRGVWRKEIVRQGRLAGCLSEGHSLVCLDPAPRALASATTGGTAQLWPVAAGPEHETNLPVQLLGVGSRDALIIIDQSSGDDA